MLTIQLAIIAIAILLLIIMGLLLASLSLGRKVNSFQLSGRLSDLEKGVERNERTLREELTRNREETAKSDLQQRSELNDSLNRFLISIQNGIHLLGDGQRVQLETFTRQLVQLTEINAQRMDAIQAALDTRLTSLATTVDTKLLQIQEDNDRRLEQMRQVVQEKLQSTLEQRLGESFRLVSERLEKVSEGLGEMRNLATGVGDLKRVLTNVKTRGTWGEVQLSQLLELMLTPDQYASNVATRQGSDERVEFAIKLPGRDTLNSSPVWLPIDSKFPMEDYLRLLDAIERTDTAAMEAAYRQLDNRIKLEAKTIHDKYISPPHTTDFAIMFLPTEGLYAEMLRRPGQVEMMQRDYRVVVAGPTTLAAILNSLQLGFRTLAIEKRSSEVWKLLGAVKTEFMKFGEILEKVQKKLTEASNTIEDASRRKRVVERKLKEVEMLPITEAAVVLGDPTQDNSPEAS